MSRKASHTDFYANSIIEDVRSRFVKEETSKHSDTEIERLYEFEDGAVVMYEWRAAPGKGSGEAYNHRFSIIKLPRPNPHKVKKGVIKVIEHPEHSR